jgi:predicted dehydrogenase
MINHLNVGIVGLGWISQVIHLPILEKLPDASVVAACDIDKARARYVSEKHDIKRIYTDIREMLTQEDIHAVHVCTSTDSHTDIAIACLEAGKDVLVEKPLARTYKEAARIVDAAVKSGKKLMVGMNNRFRPDAMILRSFIKAGELGDIFYTKGGWLVKQGKERTWKTRKEIAGGGAFLDMGIVILDLALWMMGYPSIEKVTAQTYYHETESVEDSAVAMLGMANGTTITIEVSWSLNVEDDFFYCNVFGRNGSARLNPLRLNKQMHGSLVNMTPAKVEKPHSLFKRSYENEIRHFVGAARGLHPVTSTGEEALHRMKIVEAIYESARTGRQIMISENDTAPV